MVYFTNSRALISDHVNNNFKDKDVIGYLLLYYFESMIANALFPKSASSKSGDFSFLYFFIVLGIGAICILIFSKILSALWTANGGHSSRDFMNRVISLAWVFNFRGGLVLVPLTILFKIFIDTNRVGDLGLPLGFALMAGALYFFYYMYINVKKSLLVISERTKLDAPHQVIPPV
jgi:hypothetical protein